MRGSVYGPVNAKRSANGLCNNLPRSFAEAHSPFPTQQTKHLTTVTPPPSTNPIPNHQNMKLFSSATATKPNNNNNNNKRNSKNDGKSTHQNTDSTTHRSINDPSSSSSSSSSLPSPSSSLDASTTPKSVLPDDLGGGYTRAELRGALLGLGSTEDEAAAILAEAERHVDPLGLLEGVEEEEEMRAAFAAYDADGDGKISAEELFEALQLIGDGDCSVEDCRRMIEAVDSDGDGMVCFQDFRRMMMTTGR